MKPIRYALAPLLILVAMIVMLAGCSTEQIEQYRQVKIELQAALNATQAALAQAHTRIAELDAQIAELQAGPDKDAAIEARDNIARVIEKGKTTVAELQIGIERSQDAIDALIAGDAAGAVRAIGPYLASKAPPPWNVYILAGTSVAGFVLSYIQKRKKDAAEGKAELANSQRKVIVQEAVRTQKAATSVITAIEYEKGDNDVVDFSDNGTRVSLRASMSSDGRDLVERVRRNLPPAARLLKGAAISGSTSGGGA